MGWPFCARGYEYDLFPYSQSPESLGESLDGIFGIFRKVLGVIRAETGCRNVDPTIRLQRRLHDELSEHFLMDSRSMETRMSSKEESSKLPDGFRA